MRAYIIRRFLLIIPTLFILTILVFLLVRFIPGDVIDIIEGRMFYEGGQTADIGLDREAVERMLGLDVPVYVQYGRWMGVLPTPDWMTGEPRFNGLLQGSLGDSLFGGLTVRQRIIASLPVTIELGLIALVLGQLIALPVGIYSAIRQDTPADYAGRTIAIIGMATPNFWLGIMVMIFPAIWWGWAPPLQYISFTEDPLRNLGILIIPSVILGTALSAGMMRMTRTMMLEVLRQDYIRTARSKGLKDGVVIMRHAVKNALIPIVTLVGMQLPILVGGSVIMETIFNLPGLGGLLVSGLTERDYPIVSGVNLVFASVVLLSNLFIDLLYPYIDPRVRYR